MSRLINTLAYCALAMGLVAGCATEPAQQPATAATKPAAAEKYAAIPKDKDRKSTRLNSSHM